MLSLAKHEASSTAVGPALSFDRLRTRAYFNDPPIPEAGAEEGQMDGILLKAKRFLAALAVLLVLIFLFQNLAAVEFNFLGWSISMSRALMAALIFAIGFGVGLAVDPFRRREPPYPP